MPGEFYQLAEYGNRRFTTGDLAALVAAGQVPAEALVRRDEGNWFSIGETAFGTLLPTVRARLEARRTSIGRRYRLVAILTLLLMLLTLAHLVLPFITDSKQAGVILLMILMPLGAATAVASGILAHSLWKALPNGPSFPAYLRVMTGFLPVFGPFWWFNSFYSLAERLRREYQLLDAERPITCPVPAFLSVILGVIFFSGGFLLPFAGTLFILFVFLGALAFSGMARIAREILEHWAAGLAVPAELPLRPAPELRSYLEIRFPGGSVAMLLGLTVAWSVVLIAGGVSAAAWMIWKSDANQPYLIEGAISAAQVEPCALGKQLRKLDRVLKEKAPRAQGKFPGPASEEAISRFREALGVERYAPLEALYAWHDGLGEFELIPGMRLLSLEEALAAFEAANRDENATPFRKYGFPILVDGNGDGYFIDLGRSDTVFFDRQKEEGEERNYAPLPIFLTFITSVWEQGVLKPGPGGKAEGDRKQFELTWQTARQSYFVTLRLLSEPDSSSGGSSAGK